MFLRSLFLICLISDLNYGADVVRRDRNKNATASDSKATNSGVSRVVSGKTNTSIRISPSQSPSNTAPKCGISSVSRIKRVVGGRESELGAWPWMVALFCTSPNSEKLSFHCGGTLISDRWVLTGGHCLKCDTKRLLTRARLGDLNLTDGSSDGATPVTIPIEQIVRHPKYDIKHHQFNIALLRLSTPVNFTKHISPICLLSGDEYKSDEYYKNKKGYVVGWGVETLYGPGYGEMLRETQVPIVSTAMCNSSYEPIKKEIAIDETKLCAGDSRTDFCSGDSGGPLMFWDRKTQAYYQGGIAVAGVRCADKYPGVYTRVAAFIDWINQSTGLTF